LLPGRQNRWRNRKAPRVTDGHAPVDGRFSGGRTWWAHFKFTRINIGPTILRKKIEDVREAGADNW